MLLALRPLLRTHDFAATLAFYIDVLGLECTGRDDASSWATVERDGVALMIAAPNAHEPFAQPGFTGSLYFETDDVDALWRAFEGRARVCYPPETFDYGMREFAIYDNNGYLLQFGQEI